jgi:ABC-type tungstate transport system permease subunit
MVLTIPLAHRLIGSTTRPRKEPKVIMAVAKSTAAARRINRYDVMLLNPAKHPVPKQASARRFAQWLTSAERQAAIGGFQMGGICFIPRPPRQQ